MQYRINRSALVALLEQWERDRPPAGGQDVATRLSQWLGAMDAVRLDTALRTLDGSRAASTASPRAPDGHQLQTLWDQGRAEVLALAAQHGAPDPVPRGRAQRPLAKTADATSEPPPYATEQRRYLQSQRQIALSVGTVRHRVRQQLGRGSVKQQQLAALDAVLETLLAEREQKIWAELTVFLKRRWQWHATVAAETAGGDRSAFQEDVRALLAAEAQTRLLPVLGLVEAAHNN